MTEERMDSSNMLKESLSTQAELASFDPTFETSIHTDTSHFAGGSMFAPTNPVTGVERPVAFHSFKFQWSRAQLPNSRQGAHAHSLRGSKISMDVLGTRKGVYGSPRPNALLEVNRFVQRETCEMGRDSSRFKIEWYYKPGKENVVADGLSRRSDMLEDDRLPALLIIRKPHNKQYHEERARGEIVPTKGLLRAALTHTTCPGWDV